MKSLTMDQVKDIMSTAIESGIAYWMNEDCSNVEIKKSEGFGVSENIDDWVYLSVSFDWEDAHYDVTLEEMLDKFDAFSIEFSNEEVYDGFVNRLLTDNYDAGDADVYFQFCAFGEVVYG